MERTVLTFKPESDTKSGKGLRLFIRDGVVMNPAVDTAILEGIKNSDLTAVAIRKTGFKKRSLISEPAE